VGLLAASNVERWVVLLPALIVGAGLVFGVLILLARAFAVTVRESGHPRVIYAGLLGLVVVVAVLTYLGVELPRE
jgi:hypothetical protein